MRAYNTSGLHRVHTLLIHTSLSSSTLVNAERRDRAESLSVKSRVVFVRGDWGVCPGHWISRYGTKLPILCWYATVTPSCPPHWLYLQIPSWLSRHQHLRVRECGEGRSRRTRQRFGRRRWLLAPPGRSRGTGTPTVSPRATRYEIDTSLHNIATNSVHLLPRPTTAVRLNDCYWDRSGSGLTSENPFFIILQVNCIFTQYRLQIVRPNCLQNSAHEVMYWKR